MGVADERVEKPFLVRMAKLGISVNLQNQV